MKELVTLNMGTGPGRIAERWACRSERLKAVRRTNIPPLASAPLLKLIVMRYDEETVGNDVRLMRTFQNSLVSSP